MTGDTPRKVGRKALGLGLSVAVISLFWGVPVGCAIQWHAASRLTDNLRTHRSIHAEAVLRLTETEFLGFHPWSIFLVVSGIPGDAAVSQSLQWIRKDAADVIPVWSRLFIELDGTVSPRVEDLCFEHGRGAERQFIETPECLEIWHALAPGYQDSMNSGAQP